MSKVYDANGNKMTTFEVLEEMVNTINTQQAKVVYKSMKFWMSHYEISKRTMVTFGLIQSYKFLPRKTDEDERIVKCAKHIIDKYIKSAADINDDEIKMYDKLFDRISELVDEREEDRDSTI